MGTRCLTLLTFLAMLACCASPAFAADTSLLSSSVRLTPTADACTQRGELDQMYCDETGSLTADLPKDPAQWKDPGTLLFTCPPVEDPAIYKDAFADFMQFLEAGTGKRIMYYIVASNSAAVEAMRAGRLHIAGFSPGPTWFAVNLAGYVPLAVKGNEQAIQRSRTIVIARADSPLHGLADLKGTKVAHSAPTAHSGHMAPLALFPGEGVIPGTDYRLEFSGGHGKSIHGVHAGDYDAACVPSDIFQRMADAGRIKREEYKILWQSSGLFPTASFGLAHDLHPDLAQKITNAFFAYRFPPAMQKLFGGADRFLPITYKDDWALVALIAKAASGKALDAAGLEKLRTLKEPQAKKEREAGVPVGK